MPPLFQFRLTEVPVPEIWSVVPLLVWAGRRVVNVKRQATAPMSASRINGSGRRLFLLRWLYSADTIVFIAVAPLPQRSMRHQTLHSNEAQEEWLFVHF